MSEENTQTKSIFQIRVVPNAKKTELVGKMDDGVWKLRVQAVPEKGRANKEVVQYFSRYFGVPKRSVRIISGETSKIKRVEITAQENLKF